MRASSIAIGILALVLSSCGSSVAGKGDYLIRGSLVDDETGAPVSRKDIYVHVFNDAIQGETSLEPVDDARFTVRVPQAAVRLGVYDSTRRYRPFETNIEVPLAGLDYVVRLVPTHNVLLKGRMLVEEAGKWVPVPEPERGPGDMPIVGGGPLLSLSWEGGGTGMVNVRPDGSFEVRVPRTRIEASVVDTPLTAEPPILDLTGVTADVIEREIHLVLS